MLQRRQSTIVPKCLHRQKLGVICNFFAENLQRTGIRCCAEQDNAKKLNSDIAKVYEKTNLYPT